MLSKEIDGTGVRLRNNCLELRPMKQVLYAVCVICALCMVLLHAPVICNHLN